MQGSCDLEDLLKWQIAEVRFVPVNPKTRIALMANGTIDLECGSTTNNLTRQEQVEYLPVTFITGTKILTRKDSGIQSVDDLDGKVTGLALTVLAALGSIEEWKEDFDAAETAYQRALELAPNYATAWHWYFGFLSQFPERLGAAIAASEKARELDPRSSIIRLDANKLYVVNNTIVFEPRNQAWFRKSWFIRTEKVQPDFVTVSRNNLCVGDIPLIKNGVSDSKGDLIFKTPQQAGLVDAPGNRFVFSLWDAGEIWVLDMSAPERPAVSRFPGSLSLHAAHL